MNISKMPFIWVLVAIVIIIMGSCLYTVDERLQAVITQFGKPIGRPVAKAGLHIKKPFIQHVRYFDKRLLSWDGDPNQIPTKDKKYILIDTIARWRIKDALKFYQTTGSVQRAQSFMDDVLNSATRDVISSNLLVEVVRNTNRILKVIGEKEDATTGSTSDEVREKIKVGRDKITEEIFEHAKANADKYGIELVDVRIKKLNYVDEVRRKVYERMITERKRAAELYRSEGMGKKAEIEGQLEKELKLIRSTAYKKAQEIMGKADAEATDIYAKAYNKDKDFFTFWRGLDSYNKTLDTDVTLVLDTKSDYLRQLEGNPKGQV